MSQQPSAEVVFEDPGGMPKYDWAAIAAKLRAAPDQWAKIFDHDKVTYPETIRQEAINALRPDDSGRFEVKTRNNQRVTDPVSGKDVRYCTLFLRYVPAQPPAPTKKKARK